MMGPPGSGKTMLASRLPSILPPLEEDEALEAALIHSVAGEDVGALLGGVRPFRSPHHSATTAGLVGGGTPPRPGEVSLAHQGRAVPGRAARVPALGAAGHPPAHGVGARHGHAGRRQRVVPGALHAGGGREPVPLRLLRRRRACLHVHAGPGERLPEPHRRAAHGPYRPARRRAPLGAARRAGHGRGNVVGRHARRRAGCARVRLLATGAGRRRRGDGGPCSLVRPRAGRRGLLRGRGASRPHERARHHAHARGGAHHRGHGGGGVGGAGAPVRGARVPLAGGGGDMRLGAPAPSSRAATAPSPRRSRACRTRRGASTSWATRVRSRRAWPWWARAGRRPMARAAPGASPARQRGGALWSYRAARADATRRPTRPRSPRARRRWRSSGAAATSRTRRRTRACSSASSTAAGRWCPSSRGTGSRGPICSGSATASSRGSPGPCSSWRPGCRRARSPPPTRRSRRTATCSWCPAPSRRPRRAARTACCTRGRSPSWTTRRSRTPCSPCSDA